MGLNHALIVTHHCFYSFVYKRLWEIAICYCKVPHSDRASWSFKALVYASWDFVVTHRKGVDNFCLFFFGKLNNVDISLYLKLTDCWNWHTSCKCNHVKQSVLKLPAKI